MMDWMPFLAHDAGAPWTFLDSGFWVFLVGVLLVDGLWNRDRHRALRHGWLLLASLLFYWKTSGWFVGILIFSTFSDHLIGHRIARSNSTRGRNASNWGKGVHCVPVFSAMSEGPMTRMAVSGARA